MLNTFLFSILARTINEINRDLKQLVTRGTSLAPCAKVTSLMGGV